MLNRCITGGPISFKKEVVPTQYVDSVRALAGEPINFISGVGCFDVSEPDVFIVFSLNIIFTMVAVHHYSLSQDIYAVHLDDF